MAYLLVEYQTMGNEVFETETGPTIGYDNVETGFQVIEEDMLADTFDPETYRSVKVLAEMDINQARWLHRTLTGALGHKII